MPRTANAIIWLDATTIQSDEKRDSQMNAPLPLAITTTLDKLSSGENVRTPTNIKALADSIKETGLLQPLMVRPAPNGKGGFVVTDGHRRLAALVMNATEGKIELSKVTVPILVKDIKDDAQRVEFQLAANLSRVDMTNGEKARAFYQAKANQKLGVKKLSLLTGYSDSMVGDLCAIGGLPNDFLKHWDRGHQFVSHALLVYLSKHEEEHKEALEKLGKGEEYITKEALEKDVETDDEKEEETERKGRGGQKLPKLLGVGGAWKAHWAEIKGEKLPKPAIQAINYMMRFCADNGVDADAFDVEKLIKHTAPRIAKSRAKTQKTDSED